MELDMTYEGYPNFEGEAALKQAAPFAQERSAGFGFGQRDMQWVIQDNQVEEFKRLALKHLRRAVQYDH